jgi:hypothetical protein
MTPRSSFFSVLRDLSEFSRCDCRHVDCGRTTEYDDTGVDRFVDVASPGALDQLMDRVVADSRYKETLSNWTGHGVFMPGS